MPRDAMPFCASYAHATSMFVSHAHRHAALVLAVCEFEQEGSRRGGILRAQHPEVSSQPPARYAHRGRRVRSAAHRIVLLLPARRGGAPVVAPVAAAWSRARARASHGVFGER